jgi:hypothetical protein
MVILHVHVTIQTYLRSTTFISCGTMGKKNTKIPKIPKDQQIDIEVTDDEKVWLNQFVDVFGDITPTRGKSDGSRMEYVCDTVLPKYWELYYPEKDDEERKRMHESACKVSDVLLIRLIGGG